MELRHLRYFLAVGEALNFTKDAAQLRVAQPALSRQVQDLEDEIGVDLMKRGSRDVTLTAEGKLFLDEVRELLKRADESVEKVRALARGEYGELHVGYAPSPTVEILPPALAASKARISGLWKRRLTPIVADLASSSAMTAMMKKHQANGASQASPSLCPGRLRPENRGSSAPTPSLALRSWQRENRPPSVGVSNRFGSRERRGCLFPLPSDGRGSG